MFYFPLKVFSRAMRGAGTIVLLQCSLARSLARRSRSGSVIPATPAATPTWAYLPSLAFSLLLDLPGLDALSLSPFAFHLPRGPSTSTQRSIDPAGQHSSSSRLHPSDHLLDVQYQCSLLKAQGPHTHHSRARTAPARQRVAKRPRFRLVFKISISSPDLIVARAQAPIT